MLINFGAIPLINYLKKNVIEEKPFWVYNSLKENFTEDQTLSHGGAAEILGIRKSELIDIYDKLGYSYLDMTMGELDLELETFRQLKMS